MKGETTSVSGVKSVRTMFSGKTKKQDVIIRDTTAYMKLVLWDKYVNTLQLNKTYLFKNVRVKAAQSDRYLNTPRSDEFVATECEKFTGPLVEVEEDINTTSTIIGYILGVQRASKSLRCVSCNKTADVLENKAICKSCSLTQLPKQCHVVWSVRLLVKRDDSTKNLRLVGSNKLLEKFFSINNSLVTLALVSEEELILSILDNILKTFVFTCDNINLQITDVSS